MLGTSHKPFSGGRCEEGTSEETQVYFSVHAASELLADDADTRENGNFRSALRFLLSLLLVLWNATANAADAVPLNPTNPSQTYGMTTALSENMAAVGDPQQGVVEVFQLKDGKWIHQTQLKPLKSEGKTQFGASLALANETLLIGAPGEMVEGKANAGAAYLFHLQNNSWKAGEKLTAPTPNAGDYFAVSSALSDNIPIIGAHLRDTDTATDAGAVFVFTRAGKLQTTLTAPTPKSGGLFGNSLAADATTLAVGAYGDDTDAPGAGAVYVYTKDDKGFSAPKRLHTQEPKAFAELGWSVALGGDRLVASAPYEDTSPTDLGAVYVFQRTKKGWNTVSNVRLTRPKDELPSQRFGGSVAITPDGWTVIVGSPYGNAYRFMTGRGGWGAAGDLLPLAKAYSSHRLYPATLSSNGTHILIGAPALKGANGQAVIFPISR